MEKSASDASISSYGVSNTSLEEVFLELAEDNEGNEEEDINNKLNEFPSGLVPMQVNLNNLEYLSAMSQVWLLVEKRFTIQRKDLKGLFFTMLFPIILIFFVMLTLLINIAVESASIDLTVDLYKSIGKCFMLVE